MGRLFGSLSGKYKDKEGNPIGVYEWRKQNQNQRSPKIALHPKVFEYLKKYQEKTKKTFSDIIKDLIKYRIEHQKCHI